MNTVTVVTARIEPGIYKLIEQGRKHYEVRDGSFQHAEAIRYVDAETGKVLGVYWLGPEDDFDRTHDPLVQNLSGVDGDTFHRLFPKMAARLYIARIRSRTSLVDIFPEVEE